MAIAVLLGISMTLSVTTAPSAHAVSAKKTKIHKRGKTVIMEANAWNSTMCPKDGVNKFICQFKTSAKTKSAGNGKPVKVNKIRNTFTARCSGVGISISAGKSGIGVGASVSSNEATNYVQNKNKSIVDKSGAVTCHIDPLRLAAEYLLLIWATKMFDRYTTGSYTEAWIKGTADHTSWAWTW